MRKQVYIATGICLFAAGIFAPLFVGVTYVMSVYESGNMQLRFMYVIPLVEYGLRDMYAITLFLGYMILDFVAGLFLLYEGLNS